MDNKHYSKSPTARSDHLLQAEFSPSATFTEQPPADLPNDPGSNEMFLGGVNLTSLHIPPLAWQHVVRPAGRDACPLDHPLEHRQQQGDEPQKHQLCITQGQRAKVSCGKHRILSHPESQSKGSRRFCKRATGWVIAHMEQVLPFSGSTKQVFFKMRFCNRD
jgi:hypothetical protein